MEIKKMEIDITKSNFEFLSLNNEQKKANDCGTALSVNMPFLFFANLHSNKYTYDVIIKILEKTLSKEFKTTLEAIIEIRDRIDSTFGETISDLIVINSYNRFILKNTSTNKLLKLIKSDIDNMANITRQICELSVKSYSLVPLTYDYIGKSLADNIFVGILPTLINNRYYLAPVYRCFSCEAFMYLFYAECVYNNNIKVKLCENCGKFFIPISRADEKYCNNIFKNGKTCKDIGYTESKLKNDTVMFAYRKIYKTQNARKQRNKTNIKDIDNKFLLWKTYAVEQLQLCKDGKISELEMTTKISENSWMVGDINGNS